MIRQANQLRVLLPYQLLFYITIRFTNSENIEFILGELLSFILVLIGVASWETVKKQQE